MTGTTTTTAAAVAAEDPLPPSDAERKNNKGKKDFGVDGSSSSSILPPEGTESEESEELRKLIALYLKRERKGKEGRWAAHLWPMLEARGWTYDDVHRAPKEPAAAADGEGGGEDQAEAEEKKKASSAKGVDRYFLPPGVERKKPFRNRVDYFDSIRRAITHLYHKEAWARQAMRDELAKAEKEGVDVLPAKSSTERKAQREMIKYLPKDVSKSGLSSATKKRKTSLSSSVDPGGFVSITDEEREEALRILMECDGDDDDDDDDDGDEGHDNDEDDEEN